MRLTCGVDIGGTKIAGGVVDAAGNLLAQSRVSSPATDPGAIRDAVVGLVAGLRADHDVAAVGVGAAGYVAADRSTVLFAPNIAWRDEPLGEALARRIDLPVVVENDANAAAWGEYRFGAGRSSAHVRHQLMVTVGTGLGGGVVADGRLLRGGFGVAAEVGHLCLVRDGALCGCGNRGCFEAYASGTALVRNAREAATGSPLGAGLLARAGGDAEAITGPLIAGAAAEGDGLAREQVEQLGHWLGHGLASLASVLDPELIVIGGGVSETGELLLEPARRTFRRQLSGRGHRPEAEIRLAELGAAAGVVGAADLARVQ